ncbi:hypothetical protein [Thalassobaculum sp.]|uniref:hypothetical protein n=1 Tax=Thalassobaculum sp. TaxID=2022740 RepID=UPI003B5BC0C8
MSKINLESAEFRVNSQNGEDGTLEVLASYLKEPDKAFLEIGCSDGRENNSTYLLKKGWSGVGIDADADKIGQFAKMADELGWGKQLRLVAGAVSYFTVPKVLEIVGNSEPDIFSLDIDSIDYYVMHKFLAEGFRPKIICAEFNPFLGDDPITVEYNEAFRRYEYDPQRGLYFGVSLNAYRHLLEPYGYKFVGANKDGCNIFFVREDAFDAETLDRFEYLDFSYTTVFVNKYKMAGEALRDELLARPNLKFIDVRTLDVEAAAQAYAKAKPRKAAEPEKPQPSVVVAQEANESLESPVYHGVTTFHAEGFEKHGREFIESFERHWPAGTKLWVMAENCQPPQTEKVQVRDLLTSCPALVEFKQRHAANPGARGRFGRIYDYQLDSVRWSHKVYAVEAAAEFSDADILIYVDADIVCFQDMPLSFLNSLMPSWADIGYMPRKRMYSECSFVLYRIKRPEVQRFIKEHSSYYTNDKVFSLPRWTDCHIFDRLVQEYTRDQRLKFYNLNEGIPDSMHPFINGPLGGYMDHLKGARKDGGQSYASDLIVKRDEAYWANSRQQ